MLFSFGDMELTFDDLFSGSNNKQNDDVTKKNPRTNSFNVTEAGKINDIELPIELTI